MPVAVVMLITVSTELTTSILTGMVTVPAPSLIVTFPIVATGVASLSVMVTVPVGLVLMVLPLVTVPFTVNVSAGSSIVSSKIGTVTFTVVCPAGIVTVVTVVV